MVHEMLFIAFGVESQSMFAKSKLIPFPWWLPTSFSISILGKDGAVILYFDAFLIIDSINEF